MVYQPEPCCETGLEGPCGISRPVLPLTVNSGKPLLGLVAPPVLGILCSWDQQEEKSSWILPPIYFIRALEGGCHQPPNSVQKMCIPARPH